MVAKALFVLGPVAMIVGAWRSSPGLVVVGMIWLAVAVPATAHSRRVRAALEASRSAPEPASPPVPLKTVLTGTALFLAAGAPAVVVGLTRWRLDDPELRWLPLVVGAVISVLAVVSALLFLLGSGIASVAGPTPTVPARLVVVSARETGTYVNERPRLELVLDVAPDGGPTYRVTKKATVPHTALADVRPGGVLRALVVGPEEPTSMEIDWQSGQSAPAEPADRLRRLDALKADGLVSDDEYADERRRILDAL